MSKIKEVSAGILFFTEDYKLFMGRVTNSGLGNGPSRWDIPKGHIKENETPLRAAIRECWEETGFVDYDAELLMDLGRHKYASNKDIHLFQYMHPVDHSQFKDCVCTAYHTDKDGNTFPEIDAFALMSPQQWNYVMGPSLFNVMQKLFPEIIRKAL
ncbi:nudix hydrolase [Citrobacter phage CkP1]|nr:nudix hydrolase [Citrobacter phage CkP1]